MYDNLLYDSYSKASSPQKKKKSTLHSAALFLSFFLGNGLYFKARNMEIVINLLVYGYVVIAFPNLFIK